MQGEDEMGNKVSHTQAAFDALRQLVPLPVGGLLPTQQISQPSASDKLLQSVGVQSRKFFTPAELYALQLASGKEGEVPLEGEALSKAQARFKLEDDLRNAIQTKDHEKRGEALKAIEQASRLRDPKAIMTPDEAEKLRESAREYPTRIESLVHRLDLQDSIAVWQKASLAERWKLRPLIKGKIGEWKSAEHTEREKNEMLPLIEQFKQDEYR
jgi:hypothetical protein